MKKVHKTRLAYGLAVTVMATHLMVVPSFAEDSAPVPQNALPPQTAPQMMQGANDAARPQAVAAPGLMQPKETNGISYITGGIGDEERSALEAAKNEYNLRLTNADKSGAFVADIHVVIRDRKGNTLVDTQAGPLFYAKLPAGSYVIEGSSEGQNRKQNVNTSRSKTSFIHFTW